MHDIESTERVGANFAVVRDLSNAAENIVSGLTLRYSIDLDLFVEEAKAYLDELRDNPNAEFADHDLHRMVLRLPILLYRFSEGLSRASIEADVAKAVAENVWGQHMLAAPGKSAADRKAYADLQSAEQESVVDLARHVVNGLKMKADAALNLYDGIKKVMGARDMEKQVFRRDMAR